eukprot:3426477-Prymnesium_polylepis.1
MFGTGIGFGFGLGSGSGPDYLCDVLDHSRTDREPFRRGRVATREPCEKNWRQHTMAPPAQVEA